MPLLYPRGLTDRNEQDLWIRAENYGDLNYQVNTPPNSPFSYADGGLCLLPDRPASGPGSGGFVVPLEEAQACQELIREFCTSMGRVTEESPRKLYADIEAFQAGHGGDMIDADTSMYTISTDPTGVFNLTFTNPVCCQF